MESVEREIESDLRKKAGGGGIIRLLVVLGNNGSFMLQTVYPCTYQTESGFCQYLFQSTIRVWI